MPRAKPAPIPAHTYKGTIGLDLPMPTSTNRIWRVNRKTGRPYLNPAYQKWKNEADAELMRQRVGKGWHTITGPFNVKLLVTVKKRFKIDLDNRIKALLDWSKQVGLISEDKYQNHVEIDWADIPMGIHLTLTPAEVLS